eukprot:s870_g13.t1
MRLGEATLPGPWPEAPAEGLVIGCMNPTGLVGKAPLMSELPTGSSTIYAVSESHLTAPGRRKCEQELLFHKVGYQLHAGAAVPTRSASISAVGGKHRGVAFLSSVPGRPMSPTWTPDDWQQGRFHVCAFAVGRRWVQGAVIYGHAAAPDTITTRANTNMLCQTVTTRLIEQSSGLRFIAGDLNQEHLTLPCMQYWQSLGWVNAQQWASQRLGKPIEPTCKGVTVKDHVYLSPELAMYLEDVAVVPTIFKDHAVLSVALSSLGAPPLLPLWKQPAPIDWKSIPDILEVSIEAATEGDPDQQYRHVMSQLELAVGDQLRQQSKPALLPRQRGRAATTEVHWVAEYSKPPRQARAGEIQPGFHGIDPMHAAWLRQVRRLHNLVKLMRRVQHTPTQLEHASCLWQSICRSPGYSPSYLAWWNQTHGKHATATWERPPLNILEILCKHTEASLLTLEKVLNKTRVDQAKRRRADDPNLIFRDLKKEPLKPCQTLLHTNRARIIEVDTHEHALVVDPPQSWDAESEIMLEGNKLSLIHAEPDKLWVQQAMPDMIGKQLKQDRYFGQSGPNVRTGTSIQTLLFGIPW